MLRNEKWEILASSDEKCSVSSVDLLSVLMDPLKLVIQYNSDMMGLTPPLIVRYINENVIVILQLLKNYIRNYCILC